MKKRADDSVACIGCASVISSSSPDLLRKSANLPWRKDKCVAFAVSSPLPL